MTMKVREIWVIRRADTQEFLAKSTLFDSDVMNAAYWNDRDAAEGFVAVLALRIKSGEWFQHLEIVLIEVKEIRAHQLASPTHGKI